ncbi:hypothetical protein [Bacillus cereus]|uniref:hypothetical protein n=1 Tax=Bacillus cereus TaxID=1396 RepID=UPI0021B2DA0B|nr:hypothetical protein [Bacillus cereus]
MGDVQAQLTRLAKEELSYFDGTTVTRDTYFNKLGSAVVPKNSSYQFSQSVKSGLSTTDAVGGSITLGYKMSFTEGGGAVPASATQEFSAQLSATYNHTITVTSEVTNTQTMTIPKALDSYSYDKYVGAVYQLHSKFKTNPGTALSADIQNGKVVLDNRGFQYDDATFYLTATPGAGS